MKICLHVSQGYLIVCNSLPGSMSMFRLKNAHLSKLAESVQIDNGWPHVYLVHQHDKCASGFDSFHSKNQLGNHDAYGFIPLTPRISLSSKLDSITHNQIKRLRKALERLLGREPGVCWMGLRYWSDGEDLSASSRAIYQQVKSISSRQYLLHSDISPLQIRQFVFG